MAVYTNSFQNIMHKFDGQNLTYEQKLVKLADLTFDFVFDYKTPEFKAFFTQHFIEHFFNEDFAFETFDYFKIKLKNKMQEVLPFYIPLYQEFYVNRIDLTFKEQTESSGSSTANSSSEGKTASSNSNSTTSTGNTSNNVEDNTTTVNSDLPINEISVDNIDDINYADFTSKIKKNTTANENNNRTDTTEQTSESNSANKQASTSNNNTTATTTVNAIDNALKIQELLNFSQNLMNAFNDLFICIF